MNTERIKAIQETTAYPESRSVNQALLQVWNECEQESNLRLSEQQSKHEQEMKEFYEFMKDYDFIDDSSIGKLYANTNTIGSSPCYTITELLTKFKNR